ncbi:MAG: AAA family ATPase [Rikenellaceae bacterium]
MLKTNPQIELATEFVKATDTNIFLTGKAGTGKTTFLRNVIKSINKRYVITAPTGVAAFNASGVTLHSLFQLPFGLHLPDSAQTGDSRYRRMNKNKLALIRSIELLVIDEISMVRCDTLDAVDKVLREVRRDARPFGGVQLLMIGDLQQLSPICKDEEWQLLSKYYKHPYFFESNSLKGCNYITIELEEVFRQTDLNFMQLLNSIRENNVSPDTISQLNSRYLPDFKTELDDGYITLTTHNHTANNINRHNLELLDSDSFYFNSKVDGDFPDWSFPNDQSVELKKGAQVIFIKNDTSSDKLYYNGLVGQIIDINKDSVTVKPTTSSTPIVVSPTKWSNMEYIVDSSNGDIKEKEKGSFTQIPLKCAWAITIHKSQGLSFDKAIIDAESSFAHGQVYVALSRCRTFEGMILKSPINYSSIVRDRAVDGFNDRIGSSQPQQSDLDYCKKRYFGNILRDIFTFRTIVRSTFNLSRLFSSFLDKEYPKLTSALASVSEKAGSELEKVGDNFILQLNKAIESSPDYSSDSYINERLTKSAEYFSEKLTPLKSTIEQASYATTDSKEVKKQLTKIITPLLEEISIKECAIRLCAEGFDSQEFQRRKYKIVTKSATKDSSSSKKTSKNISDDIIHKELYNTLLEWRLKLSRKINKPAYVILTNRSLIEIQATLPSTTEELKEISGIGKQKIKVYGDEILDMVETYAINADNV